MKRIHYDLCARDTVLNLGQSTQIMGIVNCSPDSFSGDGKQGLTACLRHAKKLIRQGADILDIGGESTRPGAAAVSAKVEIKRVIPVIQALVHQTKIPISVDTTKQEIAKQALDVGACIINNVRGLNIDKSFLKMVRDYQAAIVLMHVRGIPATMQTYARYKDVVGEVIRELKISIEKCLEIGIKKDKIIIDPGIGFSKNADHNLELINSLNKLNVLACPILLGTSRKSFIGKILQDDSTDHLMGTAATVTAGIMRGAHIVRVHDVKLIKETVRVSDAIVNSHT